MSSVSDVTHNHSAERWQVIARQAADSLSATQRRFALWKRSRGSIVKSLQNFIDLVYQTNIDEFSRERFASADAILADVIDGTERHLAGHAYPEDYSYFSESIRQLRAARYWIAQGYSPSRPPTEAELRELHREASEDAISALFSEQPELR